MTHKVIADESLVPLRWVFVSIGLAASALAACLLGAVAMGAWSARVGMGQEAANSRMEGIATRVEAFENSFHSLEKDNADRLGRIETKVDLLLKK